MSISLQSFFEARNRFIRSQQLLKEIFVGKNDQIVIIQWPNIPLALAIIAAVLAAFLHAPWQLYAHYGYVLFILIWAIIELVTGDSLFRKLLGAGFLITQLFLLIHQFVLSR